MHRFVIEQTPSPKATYKVWLETKPSNLELLQKTFDC